MRCFYQPCVCIIESECTWNFKFPLQAFEKLGVVNHHNKLKLFCNQGQRKKYILYNNAEYYTYLSYLQNEGTEKLLIIKKITHY